MDRGAVWRQPDFRKLWAGQAVSKAGSMISRVGLPLAAVYALDASPLQMGLLSGCDAAAVLIFGLFAGAWADRLRRRPILILTDLGRALVMGTIPLAAMLGRLSMGHLYIAAAAGGILTVIFDVSYQAYLPALVERENLLEANARLAATESIAEVGGPLLTGLLVNWITAPMTILLDAVSFAVSAVSIWRIRKPEPAPERAPSPHIGREIREGLSACRRDPVLRALAGRSATGSLFLGFMASLYMVFAVRDLGLNATLLGAVISIGGASNLLGALVADRLVRRFGLGRTLIGSAVVTGLTCLLPAMASGPVAVCAAFLGAAQALDLAWPVYTINELSLRQAVTPNHLMGRVHSAMHMLSGTLLPAGALAGGILAERIGMRATLLAGAAGFLLSTLWLVFSPVRGLRELPHTALPASATREG